MVPKNEIFKNTHNLNLKIRQKKRDLIRKKQ